MMSDKRACRRWTLRLWIVLGVLLAIKSADAVLHARDSTPAAEAIISGRHAEYSIHFDGPVDHTASRLEIVQSGRVIQSLVPLGDSAPDVLFASGETPSPGRYLLRWQVRSPEDGTISSGDIPFSVAP
jgi:methionine-rich copper-binding protein CopC